MPWCWVHARCAGVILMDITSVCPAVVPVWVSFDWGRWILRWYSRRVKVRVPLELILVLTLELKLVLTLEIVLISSTIASVSSTKLLRLISNLLLIWGLEILL